MTFQSSEIWNLQYFQCDMWAGMQATHRAVACVAENFIIIYIFTKLERTTMDVMYDTVQVLLLLL